MLRTDGRRLAARGVVAVAFKLHVARWFRRRRGYEESEKGSHFCF